MCTHEHTRTHPTPHLPTHRPPCVDQNECDTPTMIARWGQAMHNCFSDAYCTNTVGNFTCSCPDGYTLETDGYTCTDINECTVNGVNPCGPVGSTQANCINTQGSYQCKCDPGLNLQPDNSCSGVCVCVCVCVHMRMHLCPRQLVCTAHTRTRGTIAHGRVHAHGTQAHALQATSERV